MKADVKKCLRIYSTDISDLSDKNDLPVKEVVQLLNAPMGLPIGRKVSTLEAIASSNTRLPTQSNACDVGRGGKAGVRVAHASSQKALAPTGRARWGLAHSPGDDLTVG